MITGYWDTAAANRSVLPITQQVRTPPPHSLVSLLGRDSATIPEVFASRTERSPESPFLIWRTATWSYRQSLDIIQGFAGYLTRTAANSSRLRVATYLENCPEAIWAWLGACFAGGVAVPLNRNHKGALLARMLSRTGASILVTHAQALERLPDLKPLGFETLLLVDRGSRKLTAPGTALLRSP